MQNPWRGLNRRGRAVLVVAGLLLGWSLVARPLLTMDPRFFQPSLAGTRGLLLYLVGRYSAAARAYWAHFHEASWDPILRGDLRAAEEWAARALRQNPADPEALVLRGEIALERERPDEALRAFREAVRLEDLASLCALYHHTSQFERAEPCFRQVLARAPRNRLAQHLLVESQKSLDLARRR